MRTNNVNDPTEHGSENPLDADWTCPGCGTSDPIETFVDSEGDEYCAECTAAGFAESLDRDGYTVEYMHNATFKVLKEIK